MSDTHFGRHNETDDSRKQDCKIMLGCEKRTLPNHQPLRTVIRCHIIHTGVEEAISTVGGTSSFRARAARSALKLGALRTP